MIITGDVMKKKIIIIVSICIIILIGALIVDNHINNSYLKELNYKEVMEKLDNKENFILLVSQTTCSHCKEYKPVFKKILRKYKLTAYYMEYDLLSNDDKKEFVKHINFDSTPITAFITDGDEITTANRIVGAKSEEYIIAKLKSNGYIE